MDIIDNASTLEDLHRDAALSMHRLNHSAVSATHCVECDEELPEARRRLAGKRIRDARCAWIARLMQRNGIGGCDGKNDICR